MWSPMPAVSWTGGYSPCWAVPPLRQWLQVSSSGFEIPNEASSFTQHLMPLCTSWFGYFLGSTPLPGNRIGRSLRMESCGSWVISHVESVVQGVGVINLCQLLSLQISGPCSHSGVQLLLLTPAPNKQLRGCHPTPPGPIAWSVLGHLEVHYFVCSGEGFSDQASSSCCIVGSNNSISVQLYNAIVTN